MVTYHQKCYGSPRTVRPTISAKESNERRYIQKVVNATIHYAQSKLGGYPFDAQCEHCGNVWKVVLTIEYVPQPPPPKIIPKLMGGSNR